MLVVVVAAFVMLVVSSVIVRRLRRSLTVVTTGIIGFTLQLFSLPKSIAIQLSHRSFDQNLREGNEIYAVAYGFLSCVRSVC